MRAVRTLGLDREAYWEQSLYFPVAETCSEAQGRKEAWGTRGVMLCVAVIACSAICAWSRIIDICPVFRLASRP